MKNNYYFRLCFSVKIRWDIAFRNFHFSFPLVATRPLHCYRLLGSKAIKGSYLNSNTTWLGNQLLDKVWNGFRHFLVTNTGFEDCTWQQITYIKSAAMLFTSTVQIKIDQGFSKSYFIIHPCHWSGCESTNH